jgi:hypothetical protein
MTHGRRQVPPAGRVEARIWSGPRATDRDHATTAAPFVATATDGAPAPRPESVTGRPGFRPGTQRETWILPFAVRQATVPTPSVSTSTPG